MYKNIIKIYLLMTVFHVQASLNWDNLTQQQYIQNLADCEYDIQELKWSYNLWPDTNKVDKPQFESIVDTNHIRAKVIENLKMQTVLAQEFNAKITPKLIQQEINRMVKNTKKPDRLIELFDVLNNNPKSVAECIARPNLVKNMLVQRYEYSQRIHGQLRNNVQYDLDLYLKTQKTHNPKIKINQVTYTLSKSKTNTQSDLFNIINLNEGEFYQKIDSIKSNIKETKSAFIYKEILEQNKKSIKVKTLVWEKEEFETWFSNIASTKQILETSNVVSYYLPQNKSSDTDSAKASPISGDIWKNDLIDNTNKYTHTAGTGHTAIWTGSEMIVWGGVGVLSLSSINTGSRYNPVTDTWDNTSTNNAPVDRDQHTAIWTGAQMIIWGGIKFFPTEYLNSGSRYNPLTDTWLATNEPNAPVARIDHTAVYIQDKMIIWGGSSLPSYHEKSGKIYNILSNTWSSLALDDQPDGDLSHTAISTGSCMIIWGGESNTSTQLKTGSKYCLDTNSWTPLANAPIIAREDHSAVWTGSKMIIWGGKEKDFLNYFPINNGAVYDPDLDLWSTMSSPAGQGRYNHTAIFTDTDMIIWGGTDFVASPSTGGPLNTGIKYNLSANSWSSITTTNTPSHRQTHTALWTDTEMIVWGGGSDLSGGRYNPSTDTWNDTSIIVPQTPRTGHTSIWTGSDMIIWGGESDGTYIKEGNSYNPMLDTWSIISYLGPTSRSGHTAIWTGQEMIVWAGFDGSVIETGSRYIPILDQWFSLPSTNSPSARYKHTVVWTGSKMIVWGGNNGLKTDTGGVYNAGSGTWETSGTSTSGAPSERELHTAVWTGSKMIIWGGSGNFDLLNSGAEYNPDDNTWANIVQSPSARKSHTAVWTGSEMIIWGGSTALSGNLKSGSSYDPIMQSWTSTDFSGAPSNRVNHTAIWDGSKMIIWGGENDLDYFNTGGYYNPVTDTWKNTSQTNVALARSKHTAVWADDEMLVWGGNNGINDLTNLGVYDSKGIYAISGTVSGLSGNQLIIQNNAGDDLTITNNGSFQFVNGIVDGNDYSVTVLTQPTSPNQYCNINNANGSNITATISNIEISCAILGESIFKNSFE